MPSKRTTTIGYMTKPSRRDPVARSLKSAGSPYKSKVEKVEKYEPQLCPNCDGDIGDMFCGQCGGEGWI